jgi:dihydrofolate reductase
MNLKPRIFLIVAADLRNGMGFQGKLPWTLKKDMKFFRDTTTHTDSMSYRNMVVMGRVTWDSIPEKNRPLAGRKNVILTRNKDFKAPEGVSVVHSLQDALKEADEKIGDIFVIGGAKVFDQFMKKQKVDGIYLTRIKKEFRCDTFFPKIPKSFKPEKLGGAEESGIHYEFLLYKKK